MGQHLGHMVGLLLPQGNMSEDIQAEIYHICHFYENSSVNAIYLGRVIMNRDESFKAKEQFTVTCQSLTEEILSSGTNCKIPLCHQPTKNLMSKNYCLKKVFTWFAKFCSKAKVTQGEDGLSVNILFVIPNIVTIQGQHIWGVYYGFRNAWWCRLCYRHQKIVEVKQDWVRET